MAAFVESNWLTLPTLLKEDSDSASDFCSVGIGIPSGKLAPLFLELAPGGDPVRRSMISEADPSGTICFRNFSNPASTSCASCSIFFWSPPTSSAASLIWLTLATRGSICLWACRIVSSLTFNCSYDCSLDYRSLYSDSNYWRLDCKDYSFFMRIVDGHLRDSPLAVPPAAPISSYCSCWKSNSFSNAWSDD